jgi:cytochrome P450 family 135
MPATEQLPPGPRLPAALQTIGWGWRPMPFMERCQRRYGDMFTLKVAAGREFVFLAHPDLVKPVFTGDPRVLHAGEGNEVLLPVVGSHSVLLLDDARHMSQRKLMLPPLHGERMQGYGQLMDDIARDEVERWPTGEPFALWPRMQAVTLEVIMRAVFGLHEGERLDRLRTQLRALLTRISHPLVLLTVAAIGPHRMNASETFQRQMRPTDELLLAEIRERRHDPGLAERDDILSLLLQARHEDGSEMGDRELRDELMTLLVAGHETTATALAWAVERLVQHPDKLRRLREEVAAGGEDDYMDAVIKETLRLRPVLPVVARLLKEPMELGGYNLPAGTTLSPCIHLIHRRPEIYPEPRAFRPERFLEQPAGTYTWLPFGGGVRRCLGASFAIFEMKRVLAAIVASLELRPGHPAGGERVSRRAITLTPARGTKVVATPLTAPARPDKEEVAAA